MPKVQVRVSDDSLLLYVVLQDVREVGKTVELWHSPWRAEDVSEEHLQHMRDYWKEFAQEHRFEYEETPKFLDLFLKKQQVSDAQKARAFDLIMSGKGIRYNYLDVPKEPLDVGVRKAIVQAALTQALRKVRGETE